MTTELYTALALCAAALLWAARQKPQQITTTEWRERMRKLGLGEK